MTYTSKTDIQTAFATLAKLERRQAQKTARLQERLSEIKAKHEAAAAADAAQIAAIRAAIADYAETHRAELTDNGKKKTVQIGTGLLKWRKQPAKVEITGDMAAVMAALKRRRLSRFIRLKEEIDRSAILKEPAAIKTPIDGLTVIHGGETLNIEAGA